MIFRCENPPGPECVVQAGVGDLPETGAVMAPVSLFLQGPPVP